MTMTVLTVGDNNNNTEIGMVINLYKYILYSSANHPPHPGARGEGGHLPRIKVGHVPPRSKKKKLGELELSRGGGGHYLNIWKG